MSEPEIICSNGTIAIVCHVCDERFDFTGNEDPAEARAFYSAHVHETEHRLTA